MMNEKVQTQYLYCILNVENFMRDFKLPVLNGNIILFQFLWNNLIDHHLIMSANKN